MLAVGGSEEGLVAFLGRAADDHVLLLSQLTLGIDVHRHSVWQQVDNLTFVLCPCVACKQRARHHE